MAPFFTARGTCTPCPMPVSLAVPYSQLCRGLSWVAAHRRASNRWIKGCRIRQELTLLDKSCYLTATAISRWRGTIAVRIESPSELANLTGLPFWLTTRNAAIHSLRANSR